MKTPLLTTALIVGIATTALAVEPDPIVVNTVRDQLRALTDTLNFYPELTLPVSGSGVAYTRAPVDGTVTRVDCINQAAMTGSTAILSPSIAGVYMGIASTTVPSSTAVGGTLTIVPTTSNSVVAGDTLRLAIGTGQQGAGSLKCQFAIDPTLTY